MSDRLLIALAATAIIAVASVIVGRHWCELFHKSNWVLDGFGRSCCKICGEIHDSKKG